MAKATREIREAIDRVALVIEVVDARIPLSSRNPVIATVCAHKPVIRIMMRQDLADPAVTAHWIKVFNADPNVRAFAANHQDADTVRAIIPVIRQRFAERLGGPKSIQVMIMGIPNVGKSTCINILAGRKIAKTGNEPAVTKAQQRIRIDEDVVLFDTPGILWPKIEDPIASYRLAATGAIRSSVLALDEVGFFLAEQLMAHYPEALCERYGLTALPQEPVEFFEAIGRQRGKLGRGGIVKLTDICKLFIEEFKAGQLGRISLDRPEATAALPDSI